MQLGVGTYTYGWSIGMKGAWPPAPMDESGLIGAARRAGIKLVQLGDNLPLHTFSSGRRRALADTLRQYSMTVELGARKMTGAHLKRYILLCAEMNSSVLRFLIDDRYFKPDLKEIEQIIRSQSTLLRHNSVTLALENHDRLTAAELRSLVENLGYEEVGICLDTANSLGTGEGIGSVTELLAPYAVNLHIKDFIIKRLPHQMGFTVEGRPAGKGMLDVPGLLDRLKKFKRCRTAILEQWTVPENTLAQTIEKEKKWTSISLKYLNAFFNIENN
jgi:sugar phosphate isomerase/epimerase